MWVDGGKSRRIGSTFSIVILEFTLLMGFKLIEEILFTGGIIRMRMKMRVGC